MPLYFYTKPKQSFLDELLNTDENNGAALSFSGLVRKTNHGKKVSHLFYEAYEELAQRQFLKIENDAKAAFGVNRIEMHHYLGQAAIGQEVVRLKVFSKHREAAFLASRFVMNKLKAEVAIWKCESYEDGSFSWDANHCQCFIQREKVLEPVKKLLEAQGLGKALQEKKIFLVGAGGLGCPIAFNLAALGLGQLGIADYDVVELSNIARQFAYSPYQVGMKKVFLLKDFLNERFLDLKTKALAEKINEEKAKALWPGYDLIIDATDSLSTKLKFSLMAKKLKIPFLSASVHEEQGELSFFLNRQEKGACLSCFRKIFQAKNCQETGVFTHNCFKLAALVSEHVLSYFKGAIDGDFSLLAMANETVKINLIKDQNCQGCGSLKVFKKNDWL